MQIVNVITRVSSVQRRPRWTPALSSDDSLPWLSRHTQPAELHPPPVMARRRTHPEVFTVPTVADLLAWQRRPLPVSEPVGTTQASVPRHNPSLFAAEYLAWHRPASATPAAVEELPGQRRFNAGLATDPLELLAWRRSRPTATDATPSDVGPATWLNPAVYLGDDLGWRAAIRAAVDVQTVPDAGTSSRFQAGVHASELMAWHVARPRPEPTPGEEPLRLVGWSPSMVPAIGPTTDLLAWRNARSTLSTTPEPDTNGRTKWSPALIPSVAPAVESLAWRRAGTAIVSQEMAEPQAVRCRPWVGLQSPPAIRVGRVVMGTWGVLPETATGTFAEIDVQTGTFAEPTWTGTWSE